jgi:glycosyltransferase involved in cell wall biosynthesis
LTEDLPMTLLETMASGVPIIATAVGGNPHVVSHRGECLLVPPEEARAIETAVLEVIKNPEETEARARAAQRKVQEGFTDAAMADQYGELYRELI